MHVKYQDLRMVCLKLNNYESFSTTVDSRQCSEVRARIFFTVMAVGPH